MRLSLVFFSPLPSSISSVRFTFFGFFVSFFTEIFSGLIPIAITMVRVCPTSHHSSLYTNNAPSSPAAAAAAPSLALTVPTAASSS